MRTVELLEQAIETAETLGYQVRHEYLGGAGGGACEFKNQKWLFVDLALNTHEQLEQVLDALQQIQAIHSPYVSPTFRSLLSRRAA